MRPHIPLVQGGTTSVSLGDRYGHRQPAAYVQPLPRLMPPSPYMHRRGGEPLAPSPPAYQRSLPGPRLHHAPHPGMMPLSSAYSNRAGGGPPQHPSNYTSTGAARPVVLGLPNPSLSSAPTRQIPGPPSSGMTAVSRPILQQASMSMLEGIHHFPLDSSKQRMHSTRNVPSDRAPVSNKVPSTSQTLTSSTLPSSTNAVDVVVSGTGSGSRTSTRVLEEDFDKPAVNASITTATPVPNRPELDIMTQGLKIQQQEWSEKAELKKLFAEVSLVITSLQLLRFPGDPEVLEQAWNALADLLQKKLPDTIARLQKRLVTFMDILNVSFKDLSQFSSEITNKIEENDVFRVNDLVEAQEQLKRARKRRLYQEEYERISGEIMARKPRSVCEKEREVEMSKLGELKKELDRWKQLTNVRKHQTETALSYIQNLMESLTNPNILFSLLEHKEDLSDVEEVGYSTTIVNEAMKD